MIVHICDICKENKTCTQENILGKIYDICKDCKSKIEGMLTGGRYVIPQNNPYGIRIVPYSSPWEITYVKDSITWDPTLSITLPEWPEQYWSIV